MISWYDTFSHIPTDIFIDRAKDVRGPTYFKTPASIRVYNDSRLRFSKRINFDVACPMDFHLYPVDKQSCEIKFESFGYTTRDLNLKWIDGAFKKNPNISLAQFTWKADLQDSYETDYYELQYPGTMPYYYLSLARAFQHIENYSSDQ